MNCVAKNDSIFILEIDDLAAAQLTFKANLGTVSPVPFLTAASGEGTNA